MANLSTYTEVFKCVFLWYNKCRTLSLTSHKQNTILLPKQAIPASNVSSDLRNQIESNDSWGGKRFLFCIQFGIFFKNTDLLIKYMAPPPQDNGFFWVNAVSVATTADVRRRI